MLCGSVSAQTTGFTYKAGLNAGNPITKRAPITEIIDFKGYDEALASSNGGQDFEITLLSRHILKFNLKKSGTPLAAVSLQTNAKASMGRIAYKPNVASALPALYTTIKPCDATLTINEIKVFQPDGISPLSNWTLIIGDAEVTNILESISTTTNGQNWVAWDLITNTTNNPTESGIGSPTVNWSGSVNTTTGAYAAASINPSTITSVLKGVRQGIVLAIQSMGKDNSVETCSGTPFNMDLSHFKPGNEFSYTWSDPIISGEYGEESLSGGSAQIIPTATISQTLVNNTNSTATATYTVTPYHQSGSDLSPFTVTVSVHSLTATRIAYAESYCVSGKASVALFGKEGGIFSSTSGLSLDPTTGEINLDTSIPGKYLVTYTFNGETCIRSTGTMVTIKELPKAAISYGGPYCATGTAQVIHSGQSGGNYSSATGLDINPLTGEINLGKSSPGIHTVTYTFIDGSCSGTASTSVSITPLPEIKANASSTTVCAGTAVTLTGTGASTYSWDKGVINGTAFIPSSTGTYTVTATNANGCQVSRSVTVTVIDCQPAAVDDELLTSEDLPVTGNVATNDKDPNGDILTFTPLTQPGSGTLTFNPDGTFVYVPDKDYSGTDSFEYQVCNSNGFCEKAKVNLTVTPDNDAPVAVNDTYRTEEETTLLIAAPGIMVNDSDSDGDSLATIQLSEPANGILSLNSDGSFTYTPNKDFYGTDVFSYKVSDGNLESNVATVTIIVTPVNDKPVATDDHFDLSGGKPLNEKLIVHDPDGDPVSTSLDSKPEHGQVTLNPDGSFTYTPDKGYFGDDEFFYTVCDGTGACAKGKITLTTRPLATVNLTPALSVIPEGNRIRITAVLTSSLAEDVELTLGYSGDAQKGKDYKLFENFVTIKIPAGQVTTVERVLVSSLIDYINEKDEHILVTIIEVNSNSVKIGTGADVIIQDVYPMDKEANDNHLNEDIKPDPLMSPNGDKLGNEFFKINNIDRYIDNEVIIFNRWGNEVYRISGYDNLDKSFTGIANTGLLTNTNKDLAEGVYYYIIYTTGTDNIKRLNKGYLILKR